MTADIRGQHLELREVRVGFQELLDFAFESLALMSFH
jgi:hypothetical protein